MVTTTEIRIKTHSDFQMPMVKVKPIRTAILKPIRSNSPMEIQKLTAINLPIPKVTHSPIPIRIRSAILKQTEIKMDSQISSRMEIPRHLDLMTDSHSEIRMDSQKLKGINLDFRSDSQMVIPIMIRLEIRLRLDLNSEIRSEIPKAIH
jgi:hypothetical protein